MDELFASDGPAVDYAALLGDDRLLPASSPEGGTFQIGRAPRRGPAIFIGPRRPQCDHLATYGLWRLRPRFGTLAPYEFALERASSAMIDETAIMDAC